MAHDLAISECELHKLLVWMALHVTFAEDFCVQPREMGGACIQVISFTSSVARVHDTIPIRAYMAL
jgi:hypothetical protein